MNTFRKPPLQLSFSTWPQTAAVCDKYNPSVSFCPRRFSLSTGGAVSYSSPLLALCYPLPPCLALCFAIPCLQHLHCAVLSFATMLAVIALCFAFPPYHAIPLVAVLCFPSVLCSATMSFSTQLYHRWRGRWPAAACTPPPSPDVTLTITLHSGLCNVTVHMHTVHTMCTAQCTAALDAGQCNHEALHAVHSQGGGSHFQSWPNYRQHIEGGDR